MERVEIIPKGVCSRKIIVELEGDVIENVTFIGGCPGNTLGVSSLLKGLTIKEASSRLKGIKCGFKSTSCPNELILGLEEYFNNK